MLPSKSPAHRDRDPPPTEPSEHSYLALPVHCRYLLPRPTHFAPPCTALRSLDLSFNHTPLEKYKCPSDHTPDIYTPLRNPENMAKPCTELRLIWQTVLPLWSRVSADQTETSPPPPKAKPFALLAVHCAVAL